MRPAYLWLFLMMGVAAFLLGDKIKSIQWEHKDTPEEIQQEKDFLEKNSRESTVYVERCCPATRSDPIDSLHKEAIELAKAKKEWDIKFHSYESAIDADYRETKSRLNKAEAAMVEHPRTPAAGGKCP